MIISKRDFKILSEKLIQEAWLAFEKKEQIIYFADTADHSLFTKEKVLIRMRWSNEGLDVVVKKREMTPEDIAYVDTHFSQDIDHGIKLEIDQISENNKTVSCSLRHFVPNIHQSFPFSKSPVHLMTDLQKDFIHHFSNHKIRELRYLIPIKSKVCSFPHHYKELENLTLSQWTIPHLYNNKIHEISMKTLSYNDETISHFLKYMDELKVFVNNDGMFKTNRVYQTYFGI